MWCEAGSAQDNAESISVVANMKQDCPKNGGGSVKNYDGVISPHNRRSVAGKERSWLDQIGQGYRDASDQRPPL